MPIETPSTNTQLWSNSMNMMVNVPTASGTTTGNDNRAADQEKAFEEAAKLGKLMAQGANSRPAFATKASQWCADKLFDADSDAERLYSEFVKASAKVGGIEHKIERDTSAKSYKVQVSKFKKFCEVGAALGQDGVDLLGDTSEVIKDLVADPDLAKSVKGSTYDNMLKVAREQMKALNDGRTDRFTTDEIRDLVIGDGDKEREEGKLLEQLHKLALSIRDGKKDENNGFQSPQIDEIIQQAEDRMSEIGHTTAAEKKAMIAQIKKK